MKITSLKPGMTVYSVERRQMGNTTLRTTCVFPVSILEVHENHVVARRYFDEPKTFGGMSISRWRTHNHAPGTGPAGS